MDGHNVEYELSKRDNVRKFNHKVANAKNDLTSIFPMKNKMNNASPEIFPSSKNLILNNNHN